MINKRNHMVELLRFVAASYVAIFHFNETVPYIANWYRASLKLGYLGVPAFFVISGYCIQIAAAHAHNPKDFIIRRFFRVFPAYWLSMAIVLSVVAFEIIVFGVNSVTPLPKSVTGILATLTLLTTPFSNVRVINWVYWTLTYELFFYLITFISLTIPERYRFYLFVVISALVLVLPMHEHWPLFFLQHWPAFGLGTVLYRMLHQADKFTFQNLALLTLSTVGLFTLIYLPYYAAACLVTTGLITLNNFKPMKGGFLTSLGDYSYSLYLIHVPLGVYALGAVKQIDYVKQHIWVNCLWDLTLLAILYVLSYIIFKKIELPSIRFGKKLTDVTRKAAV
ncbi:MAG: acyltransferase [Mucilaginibacter sp.]|nr:acyltransferase [Mucilaginibacter sp.]